MTAKRADASTTARTAPVRRPVARAVFALALLAAFCGFAWLGIWQLQRLEWKRDLIARVEARLQQAPAPPPPRADWPGIDAERDGYRRIALQGRFLDIPETRTQAVTEQGPGWWVLSPFRTEAGDIVLVNRGFVPNGSAPTPPDTGPARVTGLLRISEPGGGFLRGNAPAEDRWHSRDVAAIAAARGLSAEAVAPYFIDADRASSPGHDGGPLGGLTVVKFRDSHLSYALTWFGMALLTAIAGVTLCLLERRQRQARRRPPEEDPHAGPASPR